MRAKERKGGLLKRIPTGARFCRAGNVKLMTNKKSRAASGLERPDPAVEGEFY
jgi:hypothetical protein